MAVNDSIGIVVIGRNEGARLVRCLASLPVGARCVYVDSESYDDSVVAAKAAGTDIVRLTAPPKHTAARARNAGIARLRDRYPDLSHVMLIDGDCEVDPDWITSAQSAMAANPALGIVFGRRRERFPDTSIYNALCDDEWNIPIGEAMTCGGDVFCNLAALVQIGGYRESMIAGEDPDMATRMRDAGWLLERIDAEMTTHDASIVRFGQWWQRTRRAGHAFAELAELHPQLSQPNWRKQCRSIAFWGAAFPSFVLFCKCLAIAVGGAWLIVAIALLGLWSAQWLRLTLKRHDLSPRIARASAFFLLLGKIAEVTGMIEFHRKRLMGTETQLIEYKEAP